MLGVCHDADNLTGVVVETHLQPLADRVFVGEDIACDNLVDDEGVRRLRRITLVEVSSANERGLRGLEITRFDDVAVRIGVLVRQWLPALHLHGVTLNISC